MIEKRKLLEEISDFYNYDLIEKDNKIIMDGHMEGYYFEYDSVDEALKGWIDTLEETNELNALADYSTWTKEEIELVKSCR